MIKDISRDPKLSEIWVNSYNLNSLKLPFFHPDWYHSFFQSTGKTGTPLILYDDVNNVTAPFINKNTEALLSADPEATDYADLIGPDDRKVPAFTNIITYLRQQKFKSVEIHNLPSDSPLSNPANLNQYPVRIEPEETTPVLKLPETPDDFLKNLPRKYRHELKRKTNNFHKLYSDITVSDHPSGEKIEEFMKLMSLNPQKKIFLTDDIKQFFRLIAVKFTGSTGIRTLKVNGNLAAAVWYFATPEGLYLYNSGFDDNRFSGAGFFLQVNQISEAIAGKYRFYNFLRGNERYKYELGAVDQNIFRLRLQL